MRLRLLLAVLIAFFYAAPSVADLETWQYCGGNSSSASIAKGQCKEFTADATVALNTEAVFSVTASQALLIFDSDTLSAGDPSGTGQVEIYKCLDGYSTATNLACMSLMDIPLTGLGGSPGTQNNAINLGPGTYKIIWAVQPIAAEVASVQIRGEY